MRPRSSIARAMIILGVLGVGSARLAHAQTLALQGDHFAVNGQGKFLVFVSYFDGVRRPNVDLLNTDLQWLKERGVNGIRVFPDWKTPRVITPMGDLNLTQLQKLITLVDAAAAKGLLVDVSFDCGLTEATTSACTSGPDGNGGIKGVAAALSARRNVIFDVWNEWPNTCGGSCESTVEGIKNAVKSVDKARLVVASTDNFYRESATVSFVKTYNFDAPAYHPGRNAGWHTNTATVVSKLRSYLSQSPAAIVPIYLQEPNRFEHASDDCDGVPPDNALCPFFDDNPAHYATAVTGAKSAGAAAWTFHTMAGTTLNGSTAFSGLLRSGEVTVLVDLYNDDETDLEGTNWGVTSPLRFPSADFDGDVQSDMAARAWRL